VNGRSMLRDRSIAGLLTAEVISGLGGWMTYVCSVMPRWLLALPLSAPGVVGAVAASAFWNPIGNAPMLGVMTTRTRRAARQGHDQGRLRHARRPLGLAAAGPVIETVGTSAFFLLMAGGMALSVGYLVFVALRADRAALVGAEAPGRS
jgi:hypothetical protein